MSIAISSIAIQRFSQWFLFMLTRFSLGCQRQKRPKKIRAGRPARIFTAINASDIDVRRFQGVFFDKGA
ncbi:hypothetical protein, partial [Serratia marcescens]|uniref:hypothetical protein n=1 Tax=Serratia marcescens TaxID=615 RepID=UPI00238026DF